MDILLLLIPVSLVLVGLITWTLMWAIQSGQFEDLEGPAHQIIMDDDGIKSSAQQSATSASDAHNADNANL